MSSILLFAPGSALSVEVVERAARPAVVTQGRDGGRHLRVVGEHGSRVAERTERLGGEEGQDAAHPVQARVHTVPAHADRLGAVLDDRQAVPPGDGGDACHVGHRVEQMHRHHEPAV
jgi:hypothetical protein